MDVGGNAIVVDTDWRGDDDTIIITQNKQQTINIDYYEKKCFKFI